MQDLAKKLSSEEWYVSLVDQGRAIIVEAVFTSRWALVEGYWRLGELIREEKEVKRYQSGSGEFIDGLADGLLMSARTVRYALKLYDTYPKLDKIPEGKNISWNKLITKYLSEPKGEVVKKDDTLICPKCGHKFTH